MQEEKKYFDSNIEIVDLQDSLNPSISLIDETYDFETKIGEYKFQHRFPTNDQSVIEHAKYFDNLVYLSSNNTNRCTKYAMKDVKIKEFMLKWIPNEVYKDSSTVYSTLLGPSAMLLHLKYIFDFFFKLFNL